MDKIFRFHCLDREWKECTLDDIAELHMMNYPAGLLPTRIGVKLPAVHPKQIYCIKHKVFENIVECDGYIAGTDAGCTLECCAMPGSMPQSERAYWAPMYWRVQQFKPDRPVEVSVSIAMVKNRYEIVDWSCMELSFGFHEVSCLFVLYEHGFVSPRERFEKEGVALPDIVADAILDGLRENAVFFYDFKPSMLSRMHGFDKILAFFRRPLDLNISYLEAFIGKDFDELFPRDATDNFTPLCEYLDIDPPKSLRKAYTYNPYAIVSYMLLRQWGVRDVNLIQRFYAFDECIANCFLSKFVYFKEKGIVGRLEEDDAYRWKCADFYFRWLVAHKGEKVFVHRLLKMTQNGVSDKEQTAIEQFHDCYRYLSPSIKEEILEHGMTGYIQEVIEKEVDRKNNGKMIFHYASEEHNFEMAVCGFDFRLIADSDELYKVGSQMHNCVGDYQDDIASGDSLVMTASLDDDYCACMEIQGNRIVQAKGPYNEPLSGDICRAICCWSFICKLEIDTEDLKMREEYIKEMEQSSEIVRIIQKMILPGFLQVPLVMTVEISNKIEEAIQQKAAQMTGLSMEDATSLEEYGDDDDPRLIAWTNAKSLSRTLVMLELAKAIEAQQIQQECCGNLSA